MLVDSQLNPRVRETPEALADLIDSIRAVGGVIQPIIVRPVGEKYEVVCGHRRKWACEALGLTEIPAQVEDLNDEGALDYQLIENIQRADVHPMKMAELFHALTTRAGNALTVEQIAGRIGKQPSYVAQILKLIALEREARKLFFEDHITLDHALLLAKMTEEKQKEALLWLIRHEEATVGGEFKTIYVAKDIRLFRDWINDNIDMVLSRAPWDKSDDALIPGVDACTLCPKNSGYNTALFPELGGKDVCTDRTCFTAKLTAYQKQEQRRSRKEEKIPFVFLSIGGIDVRDPMYVKGAVKSAEKVKIVKPGQECENTKRAQWIDGPNAHKMTMICGYSKCGKHFKKETSSSRTKSRNDYNSPENVKKRVEEERKAKERVERERLYRGYLFTAIMKKMDPVKNRMVILRALAMELIGNNVVQAPLLSLYDCSDRDAFEALIKKADENTLLKVLAGIVIQEETRVERWNCDDTPVTLLANAKAHKIDPKKIRKAAEAAYKAWPKVEAAAEEDDVEGEEVEE
jgi:ParB/RepB/Spo0J family partition protein